MFQPLPSLVAASALALVAASVQAQRPMLVPFEQSLDLLVVDTGIDGVWRLSDLDQRGGYMTNGEIIQFYDGTTGPVSLSNPTCVAVGRFGQVFVGDSTTDVIAILEDLDGNGDALGSGEARAWFDSSNQSGIVMASVMGLTVDAFGDVFAAVANAGSSGTDMILRLSDLNQDGDANDAGEAQVYCQIPNAAGSVGNSIPTKIVIAPNGWLYYAEVGSTGAVQKGVWQLADRNGDGDCDDPGELTHFWTPPSTASAGGFYWGLAVDRAGVFYLTDHNHEQVWRAQDLDQNGTITPNEETLFYQTTNSTWWDVMIHSDGTVLLCEDFTPDRIVALVDRNGDGDALDAGEASDWYDSTQSSIGVRPRGGALKQAPSLAIHPQVVPHGQPINLLVTTPRRTTTVGIVLSNGLAAQPLSLPPIGRLQIDMSIMIPVIAGTSDAQGLFTLPLALPNDPGLIGSYAFQAIADVGSYRPYLTNAVTLTIQ